MLGGTTVHLGQSTSEHTRHRDDEKPPMTYINSVYLAVHKLVLRRRALQPVLGERHRVARVVDVDEDLHRHVRLDFPGQALEPGQIPDHVVTARAPVT